LAAARAKNAERQAKHRKLLAKGPFPWTHDATGCELYHDPDGSLVWLYKTEEMKIPGPFDNTTPSGKRAITAVFNRGPDAGWLKRMDVYIAGIADGSIR
jgi:hypothetical protein